MKKVLVILVALLFAMLIVSCGGGSDDPETDDNQTNDEGNTGDDSDSANTGNTGDDDDAVVPVCKIGDEIVDAVDGYTSYFAFNGVGAINPADIFDTGDRPEATMITKLKLQMEGYPERVLSQSFNFFLDDPENPNGASTGLNIYGDPVGQYYTTIAVTSMPHNWIDVLKQDSLTEAPFATMVQIYSIENVTSDISKICILAVSELGDVDGTELPVGKLGVCYDKNESFAAGEVFKFGVNAKLTTDKQAIVDMFSDIETVEDLCFCQQTNVGSVECPAEESDDDDMNDDDAGDTSDDTGNTGTDDTGDTGTDDTGDTATDDTGNTGTDDTGNTTAPDSDATIS